MWRTLHCGFFHLTLKVEPRDGNDPVLNLARIAFTRIKESPGEIAMLTVSARVLPLIAVLFPTTEGVG